MLDGDTRPQWLATLSASGMDRVGAGANPVCLVFRNQEANLLLLLAASIFFVVKSSLQPAA